MKILKGVSRKQKRREKSRGLTLVELMISLTLGSLVLLGVMQIFFSFKQTYRMNDSISKLQENGRFANRFIFDLTRMAGFQGCVNSRSSEITTMLNSSETLPYNFFLGLEGFEAAGTGPGDYYNQASLSLPSSSASDWSQTSEGTLAYLPSFLTNPAIALPGSDILVIRGAYGDAVNVSQSNSDTLVYASGTCEPANCSDDSNSYGGICLGDLVVLSDCQKGRYFQVTSITPTDTGSDCNGAVEVGLGHSDDTGWTPGNSDALWGGDGADSDENYDTDAELFTVKTVILYIGQGVNQEPSLFRKVGTDDPEELVEGVENMQILYGEDTDNDGVANRYVTANTTGLDFDQVVSLRISLLLRSLTDANPDVNTNTYLLTGESEGSAVTIDPDDDERIRQLVTTTIHLRNRIF
ncbi:PilW family protein [Magnetococcales bacterium HHB-1]